MNSPRHTDRNIGLFLFLGVFLFYAVLAPGFSVPGRWSLIATSFSGLEPFRPVMRPVWSGLVALIAALPIANLGIALNILSSFIGAGVCWFIYAIVRRIPFARVMYRSGRDENERISRRLAGITAALYAAVSLPMMITSTRGDYAGLDILLALAAIYPLMLYNRNQRPGLIYWSMLMAGLALVEYPGMLFIAPCLFAAWIFRFWKRGWPPVHIYFIAAACLLAGVSSLALYGAWVLQTPMAAFREIETLWHVSTEFALIYHGEFMHAVPRVGWLLIFGMNILPLLLVVLRELDEPDDPFTALGVYFFRLLLAAIAVVTLFNLPGSPGHLVQSRVMLVAPSVIAGIWFGFLAGYYDGVLERKRRRALREWLRAALLLMLLAAGALHARDAYAGQAKPVVAFADEVIARLDGRTFLVTDGQIDEELRLAARRAGITLNLINLVHQQDPERGRYHASLFTDPELQDMARLGVMPLLRDLLGRDPDAGDKLAFMVPPELAELRGFKPYPDGVLYKIGPPETVPPTGELAARHQEFWNAWESPSDPGLKREDTAWAARLFVIRWASRLANDLGVMLDGLGDTASADESFEKALALWPDNISATINLLERARRDGRLYEENELKESFEAQLERTRKLYPPRLLFRLAGKVRDPAALLDEAAALGLAGESSLAAERIRQAAAMMPQDDVVTQLSLARIYLQDRNLDESEMMFRRVLEVEPGNVPAHLGLFRVALQRERFAEAEQLLDTLAGLDWAAVSLRMERAGLLIAQKKFPEAEAMLSEIVKSADAPLDAWYNLALLARARQNDERFQQAKKTLAAARNYLPGMLLLGNEAMRGGQLQEAREFLERALLLQPTHVPTLERLLLIDYYERNVAALRAHSAALLALVPEHPVGLFAVATLHITEERYDLAEIPLRRCLQLTDYGPAHNDLAWLLQLRGDYVDALGHARRAVEFMPDDTNSLDTLAVIQLRLGRAADAAATMDRALALPGGISAGILVHAAEVYVAAGALDKARTVMERLDRVRETLPPEMQEKLEALRLSAGI